MGRCAVYSKEIEQEDRAIQERRMREDGYPMPEYKIQIEATKGAAETMRMGLDMPRTGLLQDIAKATHQAP
jgi:hypothetical protein